MGLFLFGGSTNQRPTAAYCLEASTDEDLPRIFDIETLSKRGFNKFEPSSFISEGFKFARGLLRFGHLLRKFFVYHLLIKSLLERIELIPGQVNC